ncbi:hypothetical protein DPSP01_007756 [Paraphaeosphaeria sporulosa]
MSQSQSSKTWKKDSSRPSLESARTVDIQLGHGVTRVVIDLWLLLVPMPFVLKIQMTRRKKFLTVMVFVFAYCAVVFTIGRTASIFIAGDTLNTDITCSGTVAPKSGASVGSSERLRLQVLDLVTKHGSLNLE